MPMVRHVAVVKLFSAFLSGRRRESAEVVLDVTKLGPVDSSGDINEDFARFVGGPKEL